MPQNRDLGQEELLKKITALLSEKKIPYMITGSVGVIFYGRPRASHDIDFVIDTNQNDIKKITETLLSLTPEFIVDEQAIAEAIFKNHHGFNVLHLPTMLKLDFWLLKDNLFDIERFKRRKTIRLFDQDMQFASPEDTILQKFLWYQDSKIEKHLIDAAFVYQVQQANLDMLYLQKWVKRHSTSDLLQEIATMDLEDHY